MREGNRLGGWATVTLQTLDSTRKIAERRSQRPASFGNLIPLRRNELVRFQINHHELEESHRMMICGFVRSLSADSKNTNTLVPRIPVALLPCSIRQVCPIQSLPRQQNKRGVNKRYRSIHIPNFPSLPSFAIS